MSGVVSCQVSGGERFQVLSVRCLVLSGVGWCQVLSGVRCQWSGVGRWCHVSGGVRWCPVSCGVMCQVSGVSCKLSAVRLGKTW